MRQLTMCLRRAAAIAARIKQYLHQRVGESPASIVRRLTCRCGRNLRRWLPRVTSYWCFLGCVKPYLMSSTKADYRIRRQLLIRGWEPCLLTPPVGERILVISPHPDDETIGAGGLLWAHRHQSALHFVILSNGENGGRLAHPPADPERQKQVLMCVRKDELLKTAHELNARSVDFLEFPDGNIPLDSVAVERLRAVVAKVRPDVVLLPWFLDNHADHRLANVLFAKACGNEKMLVLGYEVWAMLQPNAYFDISHHLTTKLSLLRNYRSQLRTIDYLHYVKGLAHARGYHAGITPQRQGAAEAFVALPCRDYCDVVVAVNRPNFVERYLKKSVRRRSK